MPIQTNTNVNPYFDDFDHIKNFYRVLYKPGYPIQARELTQSQTILQNQIERFASRFMKDGDNVVPGEYAVSIPVSYVRCSIITQGSVSSEYLGYTLTGVTSGVKAVVNYATDATDDDDTTFYVNYTSSGSSGEYTTFIPGETLESDTPNNYTAVVGLPGTSKPIDTDPVGSGSLFNVTEGYYYVSGFMVRNDAQFITLDKYGIEPTYRIGFVVTESFVTSEEDSSLLDNSQGSSNFAAPGADRLRINLTLAKRDLDATDPNFISLCTIINGQVQGDPQKTVKWDWLYDILARRTFNESGDYIVKDFTVEPIEYYNSILLSSGEINSDMKGVFDVDPDTGFYPPVPGSGEEDDITFNEAEDHYALNVSAGLAYVQGYEVGFKNPVYVYGNKPREVSFRSNTLTPIAPGTNIALTNVYGAPDIQNITSEELNTIAFDDIVTYRNFIDGFVGEGVDNSGRPLNLGNSPWITHHLICDREVGLTSYSEIYRNGSSVVVSAPRDFVRGDTIGSNLAVVLIANKIEPYPTGVLKPRYFYPNQSIENPGSSFYGYNSTSDLGVLQSTYFTHIPVIEDVGAGADWLIGEFVVGERSNARGLVEDGSKPNFLILSNVIGEFLPGEPVEQGNKTARLYNSGEVSKLQFFDKGTNNSVVDLSTETSVIVRALGSEATLTVSDGEITVSASEIALTELGRAKLLNFPYPQNSSVSSRINYEIETVPGGVNGYAIIPNYKINNSLATTKSVFSTLADTNDFSGDISIQSTNDSEIINVAAGSLFSGFVGNNYISCDNFSGDPSDQLVAGDVITFVKDTGESASKQVLFVTRPVGYGTLRSKARIYFTTTLADTVTGKTVQRIRTRNKGQITDNLIFQLPQSVVASLESDSIRTGIDYEVYREFSATVESGDTSFTLTTTKTNETFIQNELLTSIVVSKNLTGSSEFEGRRIRSSIAPTSDGRQITYEFEALSDPVVVKAIVPVLVSDSKSKKKTLITNRQKIVTDPAEYSRKVISLDFCDVFQIESIKDVNGFDIKENYKFDDGQRDNIYDISRIILKEGRPAPDDIITITFNYFQHSQDGDFFSADSYTHENGIDYSLIPVYYSRASISNEESVNPGRVIHLRDCVDFRPTVNVTDSYIPTITDGEDTQGAVNFKNTSNGGSGVVPRIPIPRTNFQCDIEFYMGKYDSLFLEKSGALNLVEGIPSLNPVPPSDLSTGIRLYDFYLPPYTFSAEHITVKKFNYKRYRMKDIASLDSKISRLEDIVTLSLLEQSALNMQVRDAVTGLDRFKNGIVVDSFNDHSRGETGTNQYRCSIDPKESHLRSPHFTDQVELEELYNTDGERQANLYQKTGPLLTLPYSSVDFIDSPFATRSINLQPYTVFTYDGNLTLTPSIDTWRDVNEVPRLVIEDNSVFNAMTNLTQEMADSGIGTVWGDWETTGTSTTRTRRTIDNTPGAQRQLRDQGISIGVGQGLMNQIVDGSWTTPPPIAVNEFTTLTDQSRDQFRTVINVGSERIEETSYGERVVDLQISSTMRTIPVQVQAYRLKPNTRYYAFFDGVDISDWMSIDNTTLFSDGLNRYSGTANSDPKGFGYPLMSDDVGTLTGLILIPNGRAPVSGTIFTDIESVSYQTSGPIRQFNTGTRKLRITSSSSNAGDLSQVEGYAEADFTASGVILDKQETVVSTRVPSFSGSTSIIGSETRTLEETVTEASFIDPVAQTFLVDANSPDGVFVTELEVYFKTKDDVQGVEAYLVSTDGQVPTEQIIPFSRVQKSSDSILRVISDTQVSLTAGTVVVGSESGARGIVKADTILSDSVTNELVLNNYLNEFVQGESLIPEVIPAVSAAISITYDTYRISRLDVKNLGSGYSSATISFDGDLIPGGTEATAEVVNVGPSGEVFEVKLLSPGSGYTSEPSVSVNGDGNGSTVRARMTLDRKAVQMGVATSEDATVPTVFRFDAPVYLLGGTNYAFVLKSPTSLNYTVYTAKLGENQIGTETRVTQASATGSLFKSQNGGLWTEDQTQDIKFILRRADFLTNSNGTIVLQNTPIAKKKIQVDPIETNHLGTLDTGIFGEDPRVIRVYHYMNGLVEGDLVQIEGIQSPIGGIPESELNGLHQVLSSTVHTFTIKVTTPATASTKSGGSEVYCSYNRPYEVLNVYAGAMNFGATQIKVTNRGAEAKTSEGYNSGNEYRLDTPSEIRLLDSFYYNGPRVVGNYLQESQFNGSTKLQGRRSMETSINLTSFTSKLSPVIDLERTNATVVRNLIDNPDETSVSNGTTVYTVTLSDSLPVTPVEIGEKLSFFNEVGTYKEVQVRSFNNTTKKLRVFGSPASEIGTSTNLFQVSSLPDAVLVSNVISQNSTTFVVDSFSVGVGSYLMVDNEIVKVSATPSSSSLTVERGVLGTTPSAHSSGSNLYIITAVGPFFTGVPVIESVTSNYADYFIPETQENGTVFSKWISRMFTFENSCDGIEIKLSSVFYTKDSIKAYYKPRALGFDGDASDLTWIPFNGTGLPNDVDLIKPRSSADVDPFRLNPNDWQTITFSVQDVAKFGAVAIKIVMSADNPAHSPLIDDFRMVCSE